MYVKLPSIKWCGKLKKIKSKQTINYKNNESVLSVSYIIVSY